MLEKKNATYRSFIIRIIDLQLSIPDMQARSRHYGSVRVWRVNTSRKLEHVAIQFYMNLSEPPILESCARCNVILPSFFTRRILRAHSYAVAHRGVSASSAAPNEIMVVERADKTILGKNSRRRVRSVCELRNLRSDVIERPAVLNLSETSSKYTGWKIYSGSLERWYGELVNLWIYRSPSLTSFKYSWNWYFRQFLQLQTRSRLGAELLLDFYRVINLVCEKSFKPDPSEFLSIPGKLDIFIRAVQSVYSTACLAPSVATSVEYKSTKMQPNFLLYINI